MSEARIRAVERVFGIWLELSHAEDVVILLALTQRELRRRRFDITVEIARAASPQEKPS